MTQSEGPTFRGRSFSFYLTTLIIWIVALSLIGIFLPEFWDVVMVFLGSYLVGDFFVGGLVANRRGQVISPWLRKDSLSPHLAYLLFALGVIISSGIAVFLVVGAKFLVVVAQIVGTVGGLPLYPWFVVFSSTCITFVLTLDVERLYE